MIDDVTKLSAAELSAAIHSGRVRCIEVMEAYLDRIGRLNPGINAILYLRAQADLMSEARAADTELASGHSRGWMHGFPHAVKDLSEVAGLPTSWGSRIFAGHVSTADSIAIARIRAAGAIFIGKTNTPEFGLGSHTTNPLHGPTRNPWDPAKSAGGSSGGAAAALSARLVPVADGSDMMGSLRNPAAFNMVYGFRPSQGVVPSGKSADGFIGQLGISGPMGRTVDDMALLLRTMAGYDRRDPLSLPVGELNLRPGRQVAGTRIAWFGDFGGRLPFEDGVLEADRRALDTLSDMGCDIEEVSVDFDMTALWQAWLVLRGFAAAHGLRSLYDDPAKRAKIGPQLQYEIATALTRSATDIYKASVTRTGWYNYMCRLFDRYDYLVMPAAQIFPFDVERPWPDRIGTHAMDTYHRWMEVVIGPTLAGLPVAAVPVELAQNGLPNGVQIVGPPRGDRQTLELARAYEWAAGLPVGTALD